MSESLNQDQASGSKLFSKIISRKHYIAGKEFIFFNTAVIQLFFSSEKWPIVFLFFNKNIHCVAH